MWWGGGLLSYHWRCGGAKEAAARSRPACARAAAPPPAPAPPSPTHLPPVQLGKGGKVVKITGIEGRGRTATVLLRGSNKLALGEAERSLHDALCVVRCLVQVRRRMGGASGQEGGPGARGPALGGWQRLGAPHSTAHPARPNPLPPPSAEALPDRGRRQPRNGAQLPAEPVGQDARGACAAAAAPAALPARRPGRLVVQREGTSWRAKSSDACGTPSAAARCRACLSCAAPRPDPCHRYRPYRQGMESYCVRAFAEALEIIPYTLAENAGLNPIQVRRRRGGRSRHPSRCTPAVPSPRPTPVPSLTPRPPAHCTDCD